MKRLLISTTVFAAFAAAQDLPTLAEAIQDIPSCSYQVFADGMNLYGCSTSNIDAETVDCILGGGTYLTLAGYVGTQLNDDECATSFANAIGTAAGIYEFGGLSSSDLDDAAQVLDSEVGDLSSSSPTVSSSVPTFQTTTSDFSAPTTTEISGGGGGVATTSSFPTRTTPSSGSTPTTGSGSGGGVSPHGIGTGAAAQGAVIGLMAPLVALGAFLL